MKTQKMPWLSDWYVFPIPPKLDRDAFVAKYLPQYAKAYSPPAGIRAYVNKHGRYIVPQTTKGSIQSQLTKRENKINEAYTLYCAQWDCQSELDKASASKPIA